MSFEDDDDFDFSDIVGDEGLSAHDLGLLEEDEAIREAEAALDHPDPQEPEFIDDFEKLREQSSEAGQDPSGAPVSELAKLGRLRHIERAETEQEAPFVRPNPPSAFNQVLGDRKTILASQAGGDPIEVVHWTGQIIEALPVAILYSPVPVPAKTGALAEVARAYLRITTGSRSNPTIFEVDVGTGGQVVVPGSYVYVSLGLDPTSTIDVTLQAGLSFYPTVRQSYATRTRYIDGQAGGVPGTVNVRRPALAAALFFERSDLAAQYQLNFLDQNNTVVTSRIILANANVDVPIQLANDITSVDVVYTPGAGAGNARLIFVLNL